MEQNFWQHMSELRKCIISILAAIALGFLLSLFISKELLHLITAPAGRLVFLHPTEALMAQLKVALLNGILVSMPVVIWKLLSFIRPALYQHEYKNILWITPLGFFLFIFGMMFGYLVIVQLGYRFLLSFASDNIQPMINLDTYLSFVLNSMLICGFFFYCPSLQFF